MRALDLVRARFAQDYFLIFPGSIKVFVTYLMIMKSQVLLCTELELIEYELKKKR